MSIHDQIKQAIESTIPESQARVHGGGGHFEIEVISKAFEGKRMLQKHRMVLQAIKELMAGDDAPVHAVDRLECRVE